MSRKYKRIKRSTFKSDLEFKFAKELGKSLRTGKGEFEYESMRIPYTLTLNRNYVPDFIVKLKSGKVRIIEVKGYLRATDRVKMIAVKKDNPELDIRLVFAANNKLSSKSKTRYVDWAEKYGFPCAVGHIPKEWLR